MESTVLNNLICNEVYCRIVLPFLQKEYFTGAAQVALFEMVSDFVNKYNATPSQEALKVMLTNSKMEEHTFNNVAEMLDSFSFEPEANVKWLVDETEKFCNERAVYNAVLKSMQIIDGDDKTLSKNAIPTLLQEALAVSFDRSVGHDFFEDMEKRYDSYHIEEVKIPFQLKLMNKLINGGLPPKSLTVIAAQTGGGKSLMMCDMAAYHAMLGKNVLYISLEMAEEKIGERLDANLLDVPMQDIKTLSKSFFTNKLAKLKQKSRGQLILKEFPTGSAHAGHFRALINELKIKKKFVPDVIYVDYLGICASSRFKNGGNMNSYGLLKAVAEELRGLGVEFNVPVITGAQLNRGGIGNSEVEMTDLADSMGISHTADLMFSIIVNEELDQMGQCLIKILKNRYGMPNRKFLAGLDKSKSKFYDLAESAQSDIYQAPVPPVPPPQQGGNGRFSNFKV